MAAVYNKHFRLTLACGWLLILCHIPRDPVDLPYLAMPRLTRFPLTPLLGRVSRLYQSGFWSVRGVFRKDQFPFFPCSVGRTARRRVS